MFTLVSLVGCVQVDVIDTTPAVSTPANRPPSTGDAVHNLAVLSVDFEPPLNYQQLILQDRSVTLLAAIENTGSSTERNVTVRAELSTPEDPDMSLTQGASIASIAPGEVQVARFARLGAIPYHQIYHLEVIVEPVDGENELGDNRRAFDIQIHQKQQSP
jgi:hypothetical protein